MFAFSRVAGLAALSMFLTGCVAVTGSKPRDLTLEEAARFETETNAEWREPIRTRPRLAAVQPLNKSIKCALLLPQEHLSLDDFQAYWDGGCKDGYATGPGREIIKSASEHSEEMLSKQDPALNKVTGVNYNYGNSRSTYSYFLDRDSSFQVIEVVDNKPYNFYLAYIGGYAMLREGLSGWFDFSPLDPVATYRLQEKNILYRLKDFREDPASPYKYQFDMMSVKKVGIPAGVAIHEFKDGRVTHVLHTESRVEPVIIPAEYLQHVESQIKKLVNLSRIAQAAFSTGRSWENKHVRNTCDKTAAPPTGISKADYYKMCNWRDSFVGNYQKSLLAHYEDLEKSARKVGDPEQRKWFLQQINDKKKALSGQRDKTWRQLLDGVSDSYDRTVKNPPVMNIRATHG